MKTQIRPEKGYRLLELNESPNSSLGDQCRDKGVPWFPTNHCGERTLEQLRNNGSDLAYQRPVLEKVPKVPKTHTKEEVYSLLLLFLDGATEKGLEEVYGIYPRKRRREIISIIKAVKEGNIV